MNRAGTGAEGGRGFSGSSSGRSSSAASSNIRPAINDGQWHSFGNGSASARTASAGSANSNLVAHNTGFSRGSGYFGGVRGEPGFGVRGGYGGYGFGRGYGWGGGWGGGWGWGGLGFGWPYWGPAWAFGWSPWYNPYWYGWPGYGYSNYWYDAPPYRSDVSNDPSYDNGDNAGDNNEDSPTAYLKRPSSSDSPSYDANSGPTSDSQDNNIQIDKPTDNNFRAPHQPEAAPATTADQRPSVVLQNQ
jgi:hypothetical protein